MRNSQFEADIDDCLLDHQDPAMLILHRVTSDASSTSWG